MSFCCSPDKISSSLKKRLLSRLRLIRTRQTISEITSTPKTVPPTASPMMRGIRLGGGGTVGTIGAVVVVAVETGTKERDRKTPVLVTLTDQSAGPMIVAKDPLIPEYEMRGTISSCCERGTWRTCSDTFWPKIRNPPTERGAASPGLLRHSKAVLSAIFRSLSNTSK